MINGSWHVLDKNGVMEKGWIEQWGEKYYFDLSNGDMLKGSHKIGNDTYIFNDDGILQKTISEEEQVQKYLDLLTTIGINVTKEIRNTEEIKLIHITKPPVTVGAVFSIENSGAIASSKDTTINVVDGKFDGLSVESEYLEAAFGVKGTSELALKLYDGKINVAVTTDLHLKIILNQEFKFAGERLSYTLSLVIDLYLLPNNRPDDGGMATLNIENWKELATNLKNNMYNTVTEKQRRYQINALVVVLIASGLLIAGPAMAAIATSTVGSVIVANYQNKFA